ncbi:MAG: hypothetical protein U9Q18_02055 [Caldisericota bacterium]|nr:hypothetical protein [Caldisericota bacterium]
MKKILIIAVVISLLSLVGFFAIGSNNVMADTIQDGTIHYKGSTTIISLGYDQWGYNYQAHMFNGYYGNITRPPAQVNEGTHLIMKWNDAWLSNKDCDGDGFLDRHYGYNSYIGSGAWLTNHMRGIYEGEDGKMHKWTYFCKIVAAPEGATAIEGVWYTSDGEEIGPVIWGAFATIQEVYIDRYGGFHGISYLSPIGPGFGKYMP